MSAKARFEGLKAQPRRDATARPTARPGGGQALAKAKSEVKAEPQPPQGPEALPGEQAAGKKKMASKGAEPGPKKPSGLGNVNSGRREVAFLPRGGPQHGRRPSGRRAAANEPRWRKAANGSRRWWPAAVGAGVERGRTTVTSFGTLSFVRSTISLASVLATSRRSSARRSSQTKGSSRRASMPTPQPRNRRAFNDPLKAVEAFKGAACSQRFRWSGKPAGARCGEGEDRRKGRWRLRTSFARRGPQRCRPGSRGAQILEIGDRLWPMPFPITKSEDGKWAFDTYVGLEEIINRRVGENELEAIEATRAYVQAQKDYASSGPRRGRRAWNLPEAYQQPWPDQMVSIAGRAGRWREPGRRTPISEAALKELGPARVISAIAIAF